MRFAALACCHAIFACLPAAGQTPPPVYSVRTFAGSYVIPKETPALEAVLDRPTKVVSDRKGGYYIAADNLVYRMDTAGRISVFVGETPDLLRLGDGGPAIAARVGHVRDLALSKEGELFLADPDNCRIRKVDLRGVISTVAGNGRCTAGQDGFPATETSLNNPEGIAIDNNGRLIIAETDGNRVRRVEADGKVKTIAGDGSFGFGANQVPAITSPAVLPRYVTVDKDNHVYYVEWAFCRVRKVDAVTGIVSNVASNVNTGCVDGGRNPSGLSPAGIAIWNDTLYVSEDSFNRISIAMNPTTFRIFAGATNGDGGFAGDGGAVAGARFRTPLGLSVDEAGNLLVADLLNHRIRAITADGRIRTLAGSSRSAGDGAQAARASLNLPQDVAFDSSGNVYITDSANHIIRKVDRSGVISTVAGQAATSGRVDGPPGTARLSSPTGIAVDARGNFYISDWGTDSIRKITPAGVVSTLAPSAKWKDPTGVALGAEDTKLYVADAGNHQVRVIDLLNEQVTVVAGSVSGFAGDLGRAADAKLNYPTGVTVERDGTIYIADSLNHRIRRVDRAGNIDTIAGNGEVSAEPAGLAKENGLVLPTGVAPDGRGGLLIAMTRSVAQLELSSGRIETIAGRDRGIGYSGDGGMANSAAFNFALSARADSSGNIYVVDAENHRVRLLERLRAIELRISSGNRQAGPVGGALPVELRVQVLHSLQTGMPGVPVTFSVVSGQATMNASRVNTDLLGFAAVRVTLGNSPGPVQIRAAADGLTPVVFDLSAVAVPVVSGDGVSGLPGSVPPVTSVSVGALIRIKGSDFAARSELGTDNLVAGALPVSMNGVCVTINTVRAPLVSVSPTEIVAQVPRVDGASANLRVVVNCGSPSEIQSAGVRLPLASASPEFYYSEPGIVAGDARPGSVVTLRANGLGDTDPPVEPGTTAAGDSPVVQAVEIRLGDSDLPAANVEYVGLSTAGPGIYEVRLRIPESTEAAELLIRITVGGIASPEAKLRVTAAQ